MLWLLPLLLFPATAWAAEPGKKQSEVEFAMTVGLRGGYDTNPTDDLHPRGNGAAFLTQLLTLDYNRKQGDEAYGVALSAAHTLQDGSVVPALFNDALTFSYRRRLADRWLWTATLSGTGEQTWSRRQTAALWRNRIDRFGPRYRLFSSLEGRYLHLNERNPLALGGFLPEGENFAQVTVTPGAAYVGEAGELGVSAALGRVSALGHLDYLGLRRSHRRLQVNVFASYRLRGAALEGSVSPFRADFDFADFDPVKTVLYTAKATVPVRSVVFEVASQRAANDTTFPFAAINLVTEHQATATVKLTDSLAVAGYGRWKSEAYQGLDLTIVTRTAGLDAAYRLDGGWIATASLSRREVSDGTLTTPPAYVVQLGMQKKFGVADLTAAAPAPKPPG